MGRLKVIEKNPVVVIIIINSNKMKTLKWTLLSLFFFIICLNIYLTISENRILNKEGVLVMVLISIVLLRRGPVYWWAGLLLFLYGLYNLFFISVKTPEPTIMEFTSSINFFFFKNKTGSFVRHLIRLIPLFFYAFYTIFLLSKPGRKYYRMNSTRISISS